MTQPNNLDVTKKLSPRSVRLLEEITELSIKGADLVPKLYSSLFDDGLPHQEILDLIEERLDIGRRRLYQLLAPDQKRSFTKTKVKKIALSKQVNRRLVVPEEPTIPPPPRVVREAEIIREPPKPIEEPIRIPKPYIVFRQKQWRDKYNWDTSHTLKLVLDKTRENIIDVRPMMEGK